MTGDLHLDALLTGVNVLVAVMMGSTGIGGLLLAPAINVVAGTPIHHAIPACMAAYVFSGLVGTAVFARSGSIRWRDLVPLAVGAGPAAFLGAVVLTRIPSAAIQVLIAALAVVSGLHAVRGGHGPMRPERTLSAGGLLLVGAVTGFGSAITGTGGPLILLPILLLSGVRVLAAIGLVQAIQIPISLLATAGNLLYGHVDLALAVPLALTIVVGVAIGAAIAHRVPTRGLRTGVGVILVAAGAIYGIRAL